MGSRLLGAALQTGRLAARRAAWWPQGARGAHTPLTCRSAHCFISLVGMAPPRLRGVNHPETSWVTFGGAGLWTWCHAPPPSHFLPPLLEADLSGDKDGGARTHSPESCVRRMLRAAVWMRAQRCLRLAAGAGRLWVLGWLGCDPWRAGWGPTLPMINVVVWGRPSAWLRETR